MKQKRVFFDLETGGLDIETSPVIQIAAVAHEIEPDGSIGAPAGIFHHRVKFNPDECTAEALKVNGYTDHPERWDGASEPLDTINQWHIFLRRCATVGKAGRRGQAYTVARLAGHNAARFDDPLMRAWTQRIKGKCFIPADFHVLDTKHLAIWAFDITDAPPPKSYRLVDLCERFEIDHHEGEGGTAHDALADVQATVKLARALRGFLETNLL